MNAVHIAAARAPSTTGNTIHELGHAIGLWHEQSREHGGDRVQPGDYINMQDYPVLTRSYPDRVSITVSRVR